MYSQQQGPPPQYPYPPPGGQGYMAGPGRVEEGYAYPYPPPPPPPGVVITGAPLDGNGTEFPPRPSNFGASFDDANIRRSFIRKTYAILMVQLLVTLAFICLFVFCAPVKYFVHRNPWFYYLSYGVFLATYLTLVCCTGLTRRYPVNLVLLSIFTLAMSYMTATISSYYDTQIVLMAIGICAVCCLTISVGSAFCKFDMTRYGWVLGIAAIILMLFGLVTLMFGFFKRHPHLFRNSDCTITQEKALHEEIMVHYSKPVQYFKANHSNRTRQSTSQSHFSKESKLLHFWSISYPAQLRDRERNPERQTGKSRSNQMSSLGVNENNDNNRIARHNSHNTYTQQRKKPTHAHLVQPKSDA